MIRPWSFLQANLCIATLPKGHATLECLAAYDGSLIRAWARHPPRICSRSKTKVWEQAAQMQTLRRRQDDALLSSQSNLEHVTRMSRNFIGDKGVPDVLSFLMMAIAVCRRFPRKSCDPHQRCVVELL